MKSSLLPNVRLVRCPRCREVLPEPADVPFYKCGGCDTILQAKHYKKANERKNLVSEGSGSVQNNEVEYGAQGGEASSSNPPLLTDPNEGINRSNAENGNLDQPGVSRYSREASSSNQPMQQPPSSSAQHFLERNEEPERNLEVTNTLREDSSLNEPSSPSHEVPSNLVAETGELEGDHSSVEQCGDSIASSSIESMEQLVSENRKVRQDEIVVEERLEAEDSRSEGASSDVNTAKTDGEADELNQNVSINCRLEQPGDTNFSSEHVLSNEPTVGGDELCSELGSPNEEVMKMEQHFAADGYSNTLTSSNKSTFHENKELSQLVTENQDIAEGRIQNEIGTSSEDPVGIISPAEVNSKLPDESEVSTAPDEYGNRESQYSVEVESVPALPTLRPTAQVEVPTLDDRSQKTVKINPREKIKEEKATETTEVVNTHFRVDTSCRDLPKSPTRSFFAYDGSVSSYDGNDEQIMMHQYRSGRSTTSSGSAFKHRTENVQAVSPGEYLHPEEQTIPVMLNEIKMPEVLSDVPYRRHRMRPRTREFLSRVPLYKSSDHLVHNEFYDHPMYYPPHQYRDVESRVTRGHLHRSDVDGTGRMISEAVWMGEEFHMYPSRESSSEIFPYPRQQMNYHGRRQTVHGMARVPYSYSHLYPTDMRWSSHLPPPGRGWYGPREPYESYTASPSHFTDSDYYSEDQRHTNQRMRRNTQPVQHFQPIRGAAPFITCYKCSELLQLPSDFLLFKNIRIHRVKCSACSSILKYTLEKGFHLTPLSENSEALLRSVSASSYAAGNSQALERPNSNHSQDKGKSVMVEMHKNNNAAAGSSSPDIPRNAKVTWKLPDRSSSPLHRLMGYSSPSAVLYGYGSDGERTDFIRKSDI